MNASNKSFGKSTLAGLFAVAAIASAVPVFASTNTTVTWNFFGGSGANSDIGTSATFTGTEAPLGSLGAPLSTELGITAYGEQVATTSTTVTNYKWDWQQWGYEQTGTSSTTTYGSASATDLFNKNSGGTENGLGLNGYTDSEISDTTPTKPVSSASYSNNYWNKTVTTTTTYDTGVIQLDISNLLNLLGYANNNNASITIGSLQSPDTAIISASTSLGVIGTQIATVASVQGGADQSTTISLSELKNYTYLNVTAAAAGQAGQWCQPGTPGQTVLLSTLSLNLPSDSGNPTPAAPAPVPASAGLTLAGALGMGMMLLARRRRSML